jgi:hypothetical protein
VRGDAGEVQQDRLLVRADLVERACRERGPEFHEPVGDGRSDVRGGDAAVTPSPPPRVGCASDRRVPGGSGSRGHGQAGRTRPDRRTYVVLNVVGLFVLTNTGLIGAQGRFVLLEGVWALVSLGALLGFLAQTSHAGG